MKSRFGKLSPYMVSVSFDSALGHRFHVVFCESEGLPKGVHSIVPFSAPRTHITSLYGAA